VVGPADVAALAVHLMTHTALTGATYDIDGGSSSSRELRQGQKRRAGRLRRGVGDHPRSVSLSVRGWNPTFVRLPHTQAAIGYAERMHAGQRRTDGTPFIFHPLEVASLLYYAGATDHLIAAGVLHDVLEKTSASEEDLRQEFGLQITRLVLSVSDDDQIASYAKRKAALRRQVADAGVDALMLFAADKLSKLRELRREQTIQRHAAGLTRTRALRARRLRHYQRSLALLQERLPDSPIVAELQVEVRGFPRERPALVSAHGGSTH
jgi:hypothetical protein